MGGKKKKRRIKTWSRKNREINQRKRVDQT